MTDDELSTIEGRSCTVKSLDEQGRITSYTNEEGVEINEPALVAIEQQ